MLYKLSPNTRLTLLNWVYEVSGLIPRLKNPKDALRPLVVATLALQIAACQPTRGFEDQNQATPTPIVETFTPQPTLQPTPTETPTPPPTLTPTPTAIPGPFESQPAIPYPSDDIVQELGITRYQVVDNRYVALDDEGYIVAQAITKENGEFTGWQRTLPFKVETNLVVPHPKETNPELLDLKKSDAPIPQFVNAMEMGGIEVDPQEIANNLQYQTITGVDGKKYVIGSYYLDLNPNQSGETLEGPIPLMIWVGEGWRETTPGLLMNAFGKVASTTAAGGDETSRSPQYSKKIKLFNGLMPPAAFSELYMGTSGNPDKWLRLANTNGQRVIVHAAFGKNVREGTKADEQYARQRIIKIFRALKRNNIKNPLILLANEPFYNDDYGRRNPGWNTQIPYYRDLGGTKWIENAYIIVWEVSQSDEFKLKPGVDFSIIGINGLIPIKNGRTDPINTFYLEKAANIRQNIAQRLGMNPEDLPFDLGMIYYIGDPAASIRAPIPLNEVLDRNSVASQELAFIQQTQAEMKGARLWLLEYAVNTKGAGFNQAANIIVNTLTPLLPHMEGFNLWMPLSIDHLGTNPQKYPQFFPNFIFENYPSFDNTIAYYALLMTIVQRMK